MKPEKKLFIGPGLRLVIPLGFKFYSEKNCPICKANIAKGVDRYTGSNDENVLAVPHGTWNRLEIPFGYWYRLEPKPRKLRKATLKEMRNALGI